MPGSGRSANTMYRTLSRAPDEGPGTSFPPGTNPSGRQDGDFYTYQIGAGMRWLYQWDATAGKWVWLGGPDLVGDVAADASLANNASYQALTGPSVTVPVAGDYVARFGAYVDLKDNVPQYAGFMSVNVAGAGASDANAVAAAKFLPTATPQHQTIYRQVVLTGLAAGATIAAAYRQDTTLVLPVSFRARHLSVRPAG